MGRRPVAAVLAPCLVVGLLLSACRFDGLSFREDDRVQIVSPGDREEIVLPVTVQWRVDGFRVTGPDGQARPDAGYFALFLDGTPQPPGEPLAWHARDDDSCVANPDCPDEEWFERRHVYTTTDTTFTLERVLPPDDRHVLRELHEVTIVLLDGQGHRIGESAYSVEFTVDRERA